MSTLSQPNSTQLESKTRRGYPSLLRVTQLTTLCSRGVDNSRDAGCYHTRRNLVIYTQLIHRTNGCCQAGSPVTLATPKMTELLAKRRQIDILYSCKKQVSRCLDPISCGVPVGPLFPCVEWSTHHSGEETIVSHSACPVPANDTVIYHSHRGCSVCAEVQALQLE